MGYRALAKMRKKNSDEYHISDTVTTPRLPYCYSNYGREALRFLRYDCENLKFHPKLMALDDSEGRSKKAGQIPYNMERDLDRLCLERAVGRFLNSGAREDAFDIYYCYCEIFHPFGDDERTGELLRLLSDHESNASSLMIKHRDHYSHSAYVFCIGLSIYRNCKRFREVYCNRFGVSDGPEAACHFLEYWGLTSLFHDVGYPFEIAHQQMNTYFDKLSTDGTASSLKPYVSYKRVDAFYRTKLGNPNHFYANVITKCMSEYLNCIGFNDDVCRKKLEKELRSKLKDRPLNNAAKGDECYYMDHAYFSGLILAKTYLDHHSEIKKIDDIGLPLLDSLCAIILHNSFFKHVIQKYNDSNLPLSLSHNQPLAYLLMLCDELQCWDRTCYGEDSLKLLYAFAFDMAFSDGNAIELKYFYDTKRVEQVKKASEEMASTLDDSSRAKKEDPYKKSDHYKMCNGTFWNKINEIVTMHDIIPAFVNGVDESDFIKIIEDSNIHKQKKKGQFLSNSSYLNLHAFALALHSRYTGLTGDDAKEDFEKNLSLEYKLSNIAQAKGYASVLDRIDCFYSDRPVDCQPVTEYTKKELSIITREEHNRWLKAQANMGWQSGSEHRQFDSNGKPNRELMRRHDAMRSFTSLPEDEKQKNADALCEMLDALQKDGRLTVYRL